MNSESLGVTRCQCFYRHLRHVRLEAGVPKIVCGVDKCIRRTGLSNNDIFSLCRDLEDSSPLQRQSATHSGYYTNKCKSGIGGIPDSLSRTYSMFVHSYLASCFLCIHFVQICQFDILFTTLDPSCQSLNFSALDEEVANL
jgi:hypothetical protein